MSTRADELIQRAQRGERIAAIREALGLTGEQFAERLVRTAAGFGCSLELDKHKLSRLEGGVRLLTAEEAAALTLVDPEARGVLWLVFGRKQRQSEPRERRVG